MSDALFSSLIYRIIGKPERWHDDYIVDIMQQYLDQTDAIEDPLNLTELAAGDQLISRIKQGNAALTAFNTLLDQSRFQMIILDDNLNFVYHNKNSEDLFQYLQNPKDAQRVLPELEGLIRTSPSASNNNTQNELIALNFLDETGDRVYLRSIQSNVSEHAATTQFHILMVLDKQHSDLKLNNDLVAKYSLTDKEQIVLLNLIHGNSIRDIAGTTFTSENTVKSHLRSLFKKTTTKSQGALISLILTHESQMLDSYFESNIATVSSVSGTKNDKQITLSGGETIAYCEYGPENGRPLIVFHSGFGSKLAVPPNYENICQKTKRRIIIPDRPGIGKTPYIKGHPQGWNARLKEFIDQLEIKKYDLLGSIISCQMAVNFAAQADQRLNKLILTSPVVLNEQAHTEYLTEILLPAARYVRVSPTFAREIYELWLKSVTLNLEEHYPTMLEASIGSAEKQLFDDQGIIKILTDVFKEGATQTLDGISHEMVRCMTPLQLDLSKLTIPVELWYGTEDKRIRQAGVELIAKEFPNHQLHICEGFSEHIYYALFEDIIA